MAAWIRMSLMALIDFVQEGALGVLTLNRPNVKNALNRALLEELHHWLKKLSAATVKAVILQGSGGSFSAGADITEMQELTQLELMEFCHRGQEVTTTIEKAPFITAASVDGYALGGGFELALACDFIYASPKARFGLPEVSLGMIPGFGGTQRLTRAVGPRLSKELIFSGKTITAEEAASFGLIQELIMDEPLLPAVQKALAPMLSHSLTALLQAKVAIHAAEETPLEQGLALERNLSALCFGTPERLKAMKAFLRKKAKSRSGHAS